jgi:hypothetical protein
MRKQLEQRLGQLRAEYESGQKVLTELEMKQANLSDTLLRISGAIQVLEEELGRGSASPEDLARPEGTGNGATPIATHNKE